MLSEKDIEFIKANEGADVTRLLLKRAPEGVNLQLCAKCIQAREKMKVKAPLWWKNHSLVYPFSVSVEQGSSQATAQFKRQLILEQLCPSTKVSSTTEVVSVDTTNLPDKSSTTEGTFVDNKKNSGSLSTKESVSVDGKQNLSGREIVTADLTGGMGIDSFFISSIAHTHYYFERNAELCAATTYNFQQLGAESIITENRDVTADNCAVLEELKEKNISLIYIDPARRTSTGGKAILLQDYEPNVVDLQDKLLEISPYVLIKVSPMADITLNLKLLPKTSAVYVVSVDNECKELLFLLNRDHNASVPPAVYVVFLYNSLKHNTSPEAPSCAPETNSTVYQIVVQKDNVKYAEGVEEYLYEPYKGLMKAGAYNWVSVKYGCEKLAVSTHLYTSQRVISGFPGKRFEVQEVIPFNKKSLKELAKRFPKANLTAKNFPLDTNALKKLSGIKDGGDRHIFAVTLHNGEKVLIVTSPVVHKANVNG